MHATIDVRFTISIDEDKTVPLATLAEFVTDQNIESVLLESMVESLDAARVEALCGGKHTYDNGNRRFQRAGTDTRIAVIAAGEHEFDLHYVEDTAADQDESSYEAVLACFDADMTWNLHVEKPPSQPPRRVGAGESARCLR